MLRQWHLLLTNIICTADYAFLQGCFDISTKGGFETCHRRLNCHERIIWQILSASQM